MNFFLKKNCNYIPKQTHDLNSCDPLFKFIAHKQQFQL